MKKKVLNINNQYSAEIDGVNDTQWSEIINMFNDATIYQSYAYGAVRWGKKSLSHIILKNEDNVVAAAQLVIKKLPLINVGIAYSPWGPLWNKKNSIKNKTYLEFMLNALINEYAGNRGILLRCTPCDIDGENDEIISIYKNAGFKKDTHTKPYHTLLIDMTHTLEELRMGINQKWRNQLNKALKNDLEIVKGSSDSNYKIFLDLQKEMHARKQYITGVDYNEFRKILHELPDSQKMKIMICKHEGKPISAVIASIIGNRAIYLLGATADSGLQLNGSNLLQWRIIEWLKTQGCTYYDLGGISPEINPGVYHFKNRLAGKNGKESFHIGQYYIYKNYLSYVAVKIAELIRKKEK